MKRLLFLSFLMLLIGAQSGYAQSTKGAVSGHVTDTTNAIIQNARIELAPTGLSAKTDSAGDFTFTAVSPGSYILQVTCPGFTATTKDVTIVAGQTLHLDISMTVAAGNEQVMVSAETGQNQLRPASEK